MKKQYECTAEGSLQCIECNTPTFPIYMRYHYATRWRRICPDCLLKAPGNPSVTMLDFADDTGQTYMTAEEMAAYLCVESKTKEGSPADYLK